MEREELLKALRGMMPETGSLVCLGCGHEHNCSLHGCAIIRAAMKEILQLAAENEAMQAKLSPADVEACRRHMSPAERDAILDWPPSRTHNPPLTLEELREMDGEPVWVTNPDNKFAPCWMLIMVRHDFVMANWEVCDFKDYGKTWLAYRRKPEEGKT